MELLLAGEKSRKCENWECVWPVGEDMRGNSAVDVNSRGCRRT